MDDIQKQLLDAVVGLHEIPTGAFSLRANGASAAVKSTAGIEVVPKKDGTGLDIYIRSTVKHESIHMPVILSEAGLNDLVYNDFHIEDGADVVIISGCGIHNGGGADSTHDGIHRFHIGENAKVKYVEKHYGQGDGNGRRIMNPVTEIYLGKNSVMELESAQIKGVDSTRRVTKAVLSEGARFKGTERLMTHGDQLADSVFDVELNGDGASADIISRSVARDRSVQAFTSRLKGNAACVGHSECDSIIMDSARIRSVPEIEASCDSAELIHEAAIGKIAGEQLIKLMTFGMSEKEAEEAIVSGFLK